MTNPQPRITNPLPLMHTIRLRAAWRFDGPVAVRRFNRPTGIDAGTRVWLVWDGAAERAELNGEPLDEATSRCDITERLESSNRLSLTGAGAALLQSVRLEIGPGQPQGATASIPSTPTD